MSVRLTNRLIKETAAGRKIFVPYITAGDRGLGFTQKAVLALARAGADAVELGVPFSDPLADGKVIQASSQRALERDTNLLSILELVASLRSKTDIPVLLMGYLNPFLQKGASVMAGLMAKAGVDGTIIPDLPPEEAGQWMDACRQKELDTVFMATPNSTDERLASVVRASTGYVYYVSVTGTTGERASVAGDIKAGVARVQAVTPLPVIVGFGISTPAQAGKVASIADGVIVGSALVKAMSGSGTDRQALEKMIRLASSMIKSVKK